MTEIEVKFKADVTKVVKLFGSDVIDRDETKELLNQFKKDDLIEGLLVEDEYDSSWDTITKNDDDEEDDDDDEEDEDKEDEDETEDEDEEVIDAEVEEVKKVKPTKPEKKEEKVDEIEDKETVNDDDDEDLEDIF